MAPHPGITAGDGFAWRLSAFYASFFVYAGITLPFLPAWLAFKGLNAGEIGLVLAAPLLVRPIALPLATRLADRFAVLRGTLVVISLASVAGLVLVGVSDRFFTILASLAIASAFIAPILPLADAYALRGLAERRRAYGPVRLWGSVTFVIANLAGGLVLSLAGAGNLIWTLVAAQTITAAIATMLVPLPDRPPPSGRGPASASLWRDWTFIAVLAASSLIQASHAALYGFATLLWTQKGLDGSSVGMLWSIGVVAEIVLFAVSGRMVPRVGAIRLLILGGAGAVLRWTVMAFDPPGAALPFLQVLHAMSYGATHLGTMAFLADIAARSRGATAQGDYAAVQGLTLGLAMSLSGALVGRFGVAAYAAMAMTAAAGTGIAIAARREWRGTDRP
jgi:MFS transporter, PPP family, 3-phenylpropionic acid transporter